MKKQTKVNSCNKFLLVTIMAVVIFFVGSFNIVAQGKFKVGDRVECDQAQTGNFCKGTVFPYEKLDLDKESGRWFRVKLDEDKIPNSTAECMATHLRLVVEAKSENPRNKSKEENEGKNNSQEQSDKTNALKLKPGDRVECGKAQIGRWKIVPTRTGSIGAVGKSYNVSGNTLTNVNADEGMVQKWKMTWEGDVLVINDGKVTLRLHYNGETQCV